MQKFDNPLVWNGFKRADCLGIFQIETPLTSQWTKRLKPSNIEELSDLISLVRPGPLESLETEKYARRKFKEEPVTYLHPALEPILKNTQGIICYQESCSRIAGEIAGFPPLKQEALRKSLSKKKPEEIAKVKSEFIQGAIDKGIVNKAMAEEIFAIIEKFQRYGFCKAHGIEYAMNSYKSMEYKVLYPTEFYCAWLTFAGEKLDPSEERAKLINDARLKNIKTLPPIVTRKNVDFEISGEKQIVFGLSHIKGLGKAAIESLQSLDLSTFTLFLKNAKKLHRNVCESLIKSGACDCYKLTRTYMLRVIHVLFGRTDKDSEDIKAEVRRLTPNEFNEFMDKLDQLGISGALQSIIDQEKCIAKRIPTIEAKISYLDLEAKESATVRSIWEKLYLGINLTCSAADDHKKQAENVISCKRVHDLPNKSKFVVHVVLDELLEKKTGEKSKTPGQAFGILKISDGTASVGLMIWPKQYEQYKKVLSEGNVLEIYGYKDSWNGKDQITVNKVEFLG